jgi:eukaryotic-like serine/threonine-protein kinase
MPVKIFCPNPECDASYNVIDEKLGQLGRCEKCGTTFPLYPLTLAEDPGSASLSQGSLTELDSTPKRAEPDLLESFGRYKVLRLLGRGGMGSVYLALDTQLKRQVALKVPHITAFADRPEVRDRFFREAQAAARFHHPNFCPIHDIGEVAGVPYLTMAFIEGKTLDDSIEKGTGWPPRRAVEVTRELALALATAHREGIIHRDLKPVNIMVKPSGGLVLMDFGLARWYDDLDSNFTPSGAVLGTPSYMPPEQAEGNLKAVGPRSDVYSLGVILYELLTGRRPFEGPMTKVLGMIAFVEPPPPSTHRGDLDPRIEAICLKAMAKKPDDRYASMDDFAKALAGFLTEETIPAPVDPPSPVEPNLGEVASRKELSSGDEKPPGGPERETSEDQSPRSSRRSTKRGLIVAVAGCAAMVLGVLYVSTDKGRIKIEINDPNAVVHVDGQKVRIEGLGEPITLRTGKHDLVVKRGDVEVETRNFVVQRGENQPLKITLEPPQTLPAAVDPTPPAVAKADPPAADVPKPREMPKTVVDAPASPVPPPLKVDDSLVANKLGMKLKLIPADEFLMGSDATDPDAKGDEKAKGKKHRVRISRPFYLGTTEVTVGQFRQFVEKTKFKTEAERDGTGSYDWVEAKGAFVQDPKYTWLSPGFQQEDDHPVVNVTWNDVMAFCEWLSQQEGERYRLPTEAEWEYACRAGQATRYSSGDDPELLAKFGNVCDATAKERNPGWTYAIKAPDGYVFTAPVGHFLPNEFGLYDMHGNVWEWCADWYDSGYYAKSPSTDPLNSTKTATKVVRGGCWFFQPRSCRSAIRNRHEPEYRTNLLGFRVARDR